MAFVEVACRKCSETKSVIKYGTSNVSTPRYHCKLCKLTFQLTTPAMQTIREFLSELLI